MVGLLDRGAREVRAKVIPNAKRETFTGRDSEARVGFGSTVYTDRYPSYDSLPGFELHA